MKKYYICMKRVNVWTSYEKISIRNVWTYERTPHEKMSMYIKRGNVRRPRENKSDGSSRTKSRMLNNRAVSYHLLTLISRKSIKIHLPFLAFTFLLEFLFQLHDPWVMEHMEFMEVWAVRSDGTYERINNK